MMCPCKRTRIIQNSMQGVKYAVVHVTKYASLEMLMGGHPC